MRNFVHSHRDYKSLGCQGTWWAVGGHCHRSTQAYHPRGCNSTSLPLCSPALFGALGCVRFLFIGWCAEMERCTAKSEMRPHGCVNNWLLRGQIFVRSGIHVSKSLVQRPQTNPSVWELLPVQINLKLETSTINYANESLNLRPGWTQWFLIALLLTWCHLATAWHQRRFGKLSLWNPRLSRNKVIRMLFPLGPLKARHLKEPPEFSRI